MPLIPHIHILFNYILLRWDKSVEGTYLNHLFYTLLIGIRGIVQAGVLDIAEAYRVALELLVAIKEKVGAVNPPNISFPIEKQSEDTSLIITDTPRRSVVPWKDNLNVLSNWFLNSVPGETIVQVLLRILNSVKPEGILKWGEEAMLWVIKYPELSIATIALEIYSEIRKPKALSPDNIKVLIWCLRETLNSIHVREIGIKKTSIK